MPPDRAITINGLRAAPGDHICVFYRGREERDRLLVPYLREGLEAGDKCICITGGREHGRLRSAILDADAGVDGALLEFDHVENTYLPGGSFSAEHMLAYWLEWSRRTFEVEHRPFARTASVMTWAEELFSPELDDFIAYEARSTRLARAFPQVALCLYDLAHFRGNVIIPVLKAHPKVFFSGMLLENPYYVDPDERAPPG